jgi:hypothetical protein
MELIVSLPRNDAELARAAAEAGADAIKVHLNVTHEASHTRFGSFDEERAALESILYVVECPVGVMPGADVVATKAEMDALAEIGVTFLDMYVKHMPPWMLEMPKWKKIAAFDASWSAEMFPLLTAATVGIVGYAIDRVEASIFPPSDIGKPFTVADLMKVIAFTRACNQPVVLPTQKFIAPDDVGRLKRHREIADLMIGAVVTGDTPNSIHAATEEYKKRILAP